MLLDSENNSERNALQGRPLLLLLFPLLVVCSCTNKNIQNGVEDFLMKCDNYFSYDVYEPVTFILRSSLLSPIATYNLELYSSFNKSFAFDEITHPSKSSFESEFRLKKNEDVYKTRGLCDGQFSVFEGMQKNRHDDEPMFSSFKAETISFYHLDFDLQSLSTIANYISFSKEGNKISKFKDDGQYNIQVNADDCEISCARFDDKNKISYSTRVIFIQDGERFLPTMIACEKEYKPTRSPYITPLIQCSTFCVGGQSYYYDENRQIVKTIGTIDDFVFNSNVETIVEGDTAVEVCFSKGILTTSLESSGFIQYIR